MLIHLPEMGVMNIGHADNISHQCQHCAGFNIGGCRAL
jgi:hypothetical protein